MAKETSLFKNLRSVVNGSPLKSNFVIGLIMMGLERVMETDFECPCQTYWNIASGICYFTIPALINLLIMLMVQCCICKCSHCHCSCRGGRSRWSCSKCQSKCCSKCCCKQVLSSIIAMTLWVIVLFLDGQYFECMWTNWDGDYVQKNEDPPQKWCKPIDENNSTVLQRKSQLYIALSQIIGIGLLVAAMILAYVVFRLAPQDTLSKDEKECNILKIEGGRLIVKAEESEAGRGESNMSESPM